MNAEWKQKWVAALRSGEYKQGQRALRSKSYGEAEWKYCCLGVLCNLVDSGKWRGGVFALGEQYEERISYVPEKFAARIGLTWDDEHTLVSMNDKGRSFAEIADYIEANL